VWLCGYFLESRRGPRPSLPLRPCKKPAHAPARPHHFTAHRTREALPPSRVCASHLVLPTAQGCRRRCALLSRPSFYPPEPSRPCDNTAHSPRIQGPSRHITYRKRRGCSFARAFCLRTMEGLSLPPPHQTGKAQRTNGITKHSIPLTYTSITTQEQAQRRTARRADQH
jgi:hypothetical protein